jgi:hypothetical protein
MREIDVGTETLLSLHLTLSVKVITRSVGEVLEKYVVVLLAQDWDLLLQWWRDILKAFVILWTDTWLRR